MPISRINTGGIWDNAVTSVKIAQDVIIAEDIANNAVTVNELATNAVTTVKILDSAVTSAKIADGTIVTADLADDCVTIDKLGANSVGADQIVDNSITLGTHTVGNYMSNVTAGTGISVTHSQGEGSSATIALSGGTLVSDNSVTLGTHTTGNYMSNVTGGSGISVSHSQGEGSTATVSIDDPIVDTHTTLSYNSGTNDFTLNLSSASSFKVTLTQNSDIIFTNAPTSATETLIWTLTIVQGSSVYAVVYPSNVHWPDGQKPTLSSASGAIDQFVFMKTGGSSNIYGFTVGSDIKAPASP